MVRYATPGLTGPASSRWAPDPATCKVTGSGPPGLVPSRPVAGKPAAVATGSSPPASRTVQSLPSAVPEPMTPLRAIGPSLAIVSCRAGGPAAHSRIHQARDGHRQRGHHRHGTGLGGAAAPANAPTPGHDRGRRRRPSRDGRERPVDLLAQVLPVKAAHDAPLHPGPYRP